MSESSSAAASTPSATAPAPGRWLLDASGSTVAFEQKHFWGLITVKGSFSDVSGEGVLSPDGTVSGTVTIAAESVDTKHAKRDKHLRSADFFHTDEHPALTFAVTKATLGANDTVEVAGTLTVRGASRPLTFTARAVELGAEAVTLTARTEVDRAWFGLNWSPLGMLKGLTAVTLKTRFSRSPA